MQRVPTSLVPVSRWFHSVCVTIMCKQGDIVVSGVIMKEWQRTPKKLVEEWCQKQKRPRPCYNQAAAAEKSGGGQKSGGGTGATRCWLTLPDPKKPEKSLKFLTEQGVSEYCCLFLSSFILKATSMKCLTPNLVRHIAGGRALIGPPGVVPPEPRDPSRPHSA